MKRSRSTLSSIISVAALVLLLAAALYLPQYYGPVVTNRFSVAIYLSVAVLSLTLLIGLSGQVSLGHSAFFGIGAYTTAILVQLHGWSYFATIPVAAAMAFVVGLLVGLPALRLRGFYLALVTLGVGVAFPQILNRFSDTTGGTGGLGVDRALPAPHWTGLAEDQWNYYVLLAIAVITFAFAWLIASSKVGRALRAIRDNDLAAAASGVNVPFYRVLTFGLSAAIASVAGSMFTIHEQFVASFDFGINRSIDLLVGQVVGGAVLPGAPVGGLLLQFLPDFVHDFGIEAQLTPLVYGAILLLCVYLFRGGVAGSLIRARDNWISRAEERSHAAFDPRGATVRDAAGGSSNELPARTEIPTPSQYETQGATE